MRGNRSAYALVTLSVGMLFARQAAANYGDPLPGLTTAQQQAFADGKATFSEVEDVSDGLGPVFNDSSCANCHTGPSGAVGGTNERLETRFGTTTNGAFDPLAGLGGSLIQDHAIGRGDASQGLPNTPACAPPFSFVPEVVPGQATIVARRRTTPLFGLGLVDAVDDATLIALAQSEATSNPATAGVVSMVTDADTGAQRVGRFGWKDQNATLHAFSGDAYINEMGITNPSFPQENCPQGDCSQLACNPEPGLNDNGTDVTAFTNFMKLLAPPPPGVLAPSNKEGAVRFAMIGCADCHTPELQTGTSDVAALNNVSFNPYSDFLLHDMGSLGDGIQQNNATGTLMRTAPLWGVSAQTALLHDGRSATVSAAIAQHDGQAAAARNAFQALNATQQAKVLAFIASL